MATAAISRATFHTPGFAAWLPLLALPIAVAAIAISWPPWVFMWALATSIYVGLKWLTFANCPITGDSSVRRSLAYLLLWPGMDAKSFLATSRSVDKPGLWERLRAVAKTIFGVFLIAIAVHFADEHSLTAGWIGMAGIIFNYASSRKQSGESEENLALMRSIDELYLKHPFYGSRKMAFELDANRKRAGRLMRRLMGIEAIYPKRRTTQRNKNHKIYPYLLRPGFILQRGDYPMRPGLEYRHHVHPDAARLRVVGSRDGLVQPLRAVVAAEQHDRRGVLFGGARRSLARRVAGDLQHRSTCSSSDYGAA